MAALACRHVMPCGSDIAARNLNLAHWRMLPWGNARFAVKLLRGKFTRTAGAV